LGTINTMRAVEDIFHFEERIAARISAAVQPALRRAEIARARRKPEAHLTANDPGYDSHAPVLMLTVEGHQRALEMLDRATTRDPIIR